MGILTIPDVWAATINVDSDVGVCVDDTAAPYCTIQAAVDAATTGDTINVAAGTYSITSDLTIDKKIILQGSGNGGDPLVDTIIELAPPSSTSINLLAGGSSTVDRLEIRDLRVTDTKDSHTGAANSVEIRSSGFFLFDNVVMTNNIGSALIIRGDVAGGASTSDVVVRNSVFSNNAQASCSNAADIHFFLFEGNARVESVTIDVGTGSHSCPAGDNTSNSYGIQFRGNGDTSPAGTIVLQDVTITGNPNKDGLLIQEYSDISGFSLSNVDLSGVNPGWSTMVVSHTGIPSFLLGNTKLPDLALWNTGGVDATNAVFTGTTNNFEIEDVVSHALDTAGLGLVRWVPNNVYVTPNSGSIQRGIDVVQNGDTINVAAGSYDEILTISKPLTLNGPNAGINPVTNAASRVTEAILTTNVANSKLILIRNGDVNPLTIDGLEFRDVRVGGHAVIHIDGISDKKNIHIINNRFINNDGRALFASLIGVETAGFQFNNNVVDTTIIANEAGLQPIGLTNCQINGNKISSTTHGGINADSFVNCQINNNIINNAKKQGIQLANSPNSNTVISGNTITNTNTDNQLDKGGIAIYPNSNDITISGNTLTNNFNGFAIRDKPEAVASDVIVINNIISGNTGDGAINKAQGGGILDARNNYWGHVAGPTHSSNPLGEGDTVDDNVNFNPWYINAGKTTLSNAVTISADTTQFADIGSFAAVQSFQDGLIFGDNTVFAENQDFSTGTQTFGSGTTFRDGTQFAFGQTFNSAQNFGANLRFDSTDFSVTQNFGVGTKFAGNNNFANNQVFAAETEFGLNQDFPIDEDYTFPDHGFFKAGTDFKKARLFPEFTHFDGVVTFVGAQTWNEGPEFADGQTFPGTDVQVFKADSHFGDNTDLTNAAHTFVAGSSFGVGTTFKDAISLPVGVVPSYGLLLETITCGTDTSASTCQPTDGTRFLSPGELLAPGKDPTAISHAISPSDDTFTIDGLGVSLDFGTVTTSGNVDIDPIDPDNLDAITGVASTAGAATGSRTVIANGVSIDTVGTVFDITLVTATTTGSTIVTIPYDENSFPPGFSEGNAVGLHFTNNAWEVISGCTVDTTNNNISCPITSFSPVGVGAGAGAGAVAGGGGGGGDKTKPVLQSNSLSSPGSVIFGGTLSLDPNQPLKTPSLFEANDEIDLELSFFENTGPQAMQHVALYTNIRDSDTRYDSDLSIEWNKDQPIKVYDPNGFLKDDTNVTTEINNSNLDMTFHVTFAKPMETSNIVLYFWDFSRHGVVVTFEDAWKIIKGVSDIVDITNLDNAAESEDNIETINKVSDSADKIRQELNGAKPIPAWIKTSAGWWSEKKINDADFVSGIEFLIQNNIIEVPETEPLSKPSRHVPDWLGNTAGWWSDGLIPDEAFIQSIQWLITNGVIVI